MKKKTFVVTHFMLAPMLVAVLAVLAGPAAAANYTSTSQVVDCIDDGSPNPLVCAEKTVIGVAVSYGHQAILDIGTDINNTTIPIEDAVRVEIEKVEPPVYTYPLKHFHTVSYFSYEELIPVNNTVVGVQSCIDDASASNPHCGWTYSGSTKIDDSQGFCSNKDLEMWTDTLGLYRGEEFLGRESTALDSFSAAHCLRMGELYYHGYEIGTPVVDYTVDVTLTHDTDTWQFSLTPTAPIYNSAQAAGYPVDLISIKAELAGDTNFGPANPGVPELDNYILYIPSAPDTHPYVQNYQQNMLLVPREEVSKDGGVLNKVGVSFYAFRHLNGDIQVTQAGDGLHNQLYNKHNGDIQKLSTNPNAEADYLLQGKKDFSGMDFVPGMKKVLEYRDTAISNSLVNLVIDPPPQFGVIETEILGNISNAYVVTFTSMSNEGTMNVTIQNVGAAKADYLVTVTDCSENILDAVPAQALTLAMGEQQTLKFNIHTRDNLEITNQCTVSLKSHTGTKFDEVVVSFDTEKHDPKYSIDLQQKNEGTQQAP